MGTLSPTPSSSSSDGSSRDVTAAAPPSGGGGGGGGGGGPSTRNFKASQAASLAAVVESANAHRDAVPGLAELVGGSSVAEMMSALKGSGGGGGGNIMNANAGGGGGGTAGGGDNAGDDNNNGNGAMMDSSGAAATTAAAAVGHPSLPSMESVGTAVARLINERPPFVTMSARDSAPQLRLEDPPPVVAIASASDNDDGANGVVEGGANFQRRLVVTGGMKGYRMSRATHGASGGCYYYEAVILESSGNAAVPSSRGVKRPLQEVERTSAVPSSHENGAPNESSRANNSGKNGHLRIGWSTRSADLQAPVGYNEHSYGVRDIAGSRVHRSRREDAWGGLGFGPGDVVGTSICLFGDGGGSSSSATTASSSSGAPPHSSAPGDASKDRDDGGEGSTSHIRFFRNGVPMGDGIAFDAIRPGEYYPSVSCYADGSARMNFGPHFVHPPKDLPPETRVRPVSELCESPPSPEEVARRVASGGGGGGGGNGKEGKKASSFFSKRSYDDGIVSVFKELVRVEATARHDAHSKHLELHRREIAEMRRDRGLSALDLEG